ncbi:CBS domain-containing protein [Salinibacter ruber]|uniref:CBS domain-containing protein n=1 Tax=Salinibacter ruber TaxID=146919 RepID=UPI000DD7D3CF|nr:CBS domain-containing protein [Salinibacter ruber]MCS3823504.1 CBS domain-containing protein [Salinibacter ruber]MCS4198702.1 CBS domain-containing protein [Salinibacter ruber]
MNPRDGLLDTRVKDIIQSKSALADDGNVLTTSPTATVFECIGRMVDRDVGSIVVMEGDAIAGLFTERNYMQGIALKGRSSDETEVQAVMTEDVATVRPDKPLEECLRLMTRLRCRHLPVVDEGGDLIGIVSIGDGVKQIIQTAQRETSRLRQYVTGTYAE